MIKQAKVDSVYTTAQGKTTQSVSIILDKRVNLGAGMSEQAELRIVFNTDGTFKIITNLPAQQIKDLAEQNKDFWSYQHVAVVERFGTPYED